MIIENIEYNGWKNNIRMANEEIEIVVWNNPEAVTYYHNKIYQLTGGADIDYEKEIIDQFKEWEEERIKNLKEDNNLYD